MSDGYFRINQPTNTSSEAISTRQSGIGSRAAILERNDLDAMGLVHSEDIEGTDPDRMATLRQATWTIHCTARCLHHSPEINQASDHDVGIPLTVAVLPARSARLLGKVDGATCKAMAAASQLPVALDALRGSKAGGVEQLHRCFKRGVRQAKVAS